MSGGFCHTDKRTRTRWRPSLTLAACRLRSPLEDVDEDLVPLRAVLLPAPRHGLLYRRRWRRLCLERLRGKAKERKKKRWPKHETPVPGVWRVGGGLRTTTLSGVFMIVGGLKQHLSVYCWAREEQQKTHIVLYICTTPTNRVRRSTHCCRGSHYSRSLPAKSRPDVLLRFAENPEKTTTCGMRARPRPRRGERAPTPTDLSHETGSLPAAILYKAACLCEAYVRGPTLFSHRR